MTPTLSTVAAAVKSLPARRKGGSKPFEAEMRDRMARVEFIVIILCLRVFGLVPGLGT